mmetsp:Transcript_16378/g.36160  ORF Transcript_16378/g.36160 Transcript_16378/m.36160 type:complete len:319 (-) Transcript_16378:129-1085(-)
MDNFDEHTQWSRGVGRELNKQRARGIRVQITHCGQVLCLLVLLERVRLRCHRGRPSAAKDLPLDHCAVGLGVRRALRPGQVLVGPQVGAPPRIAPLRGGQPPAHGGDKRNRGRPGGDSPATVTSLQAAVIRRFIRRPTRVHDAGENDLNIEEVAGGVLQLQRKWGGLRKRVEWGGDAGLVLQHGRGVGVLTGSVRIPDAHHNHHRQTKKEHETSWDQILLLHHAHSGICIWHGLRILSFRWPGAGKVRGDLGNGLAQQLLLLLNSCQPNVNRSVLVLLGVRSQIRIEIRQRLRRSATLAHHRDSWPCAGCPAKTFPHA